MSALLSGGTGGNKYGNVVSEGCSLQSLSWPSTKELQLFKARLKAALKLPRETKELRGKSF